MRTICLALILGLAGASRALAGHSPQVVVFPQSEAFISSAHVEPVRGGFYVAGTVRRAFGFAPVAIHVHVSSYDPAGNLIGSRVERIAARRLRTWKLNPQGRGAFATFFSSEMGHIARVTLEVHSGHHHAASA